MSKIARSHGERARAINGVGDTISVSLSGNSVPRYTVVELSISHSDAEFSNAWEGTAITVTFTSPTNKAYRVGGFYHSLRRWTAFFAEGTLIFWNVSGFKDNRARPASIYLGPEERGYIRGLQNITAGAEASVERFALTPSSSSIRAYGLRSARMILGYFHHFTSHQEAVSSTLTLDLPAAGTAVWIDPATGDTLQMFSVGGGRQTLTMPPFAVALALRIQWASY